jgi:ubiquinone/menaquinone biosynthesis C-methylase UbiE
MPILKVSSYVEYYRHLAEDPDFSALSGRGDDMSATQFANSRILEALELVRTDSLLDVGCGDGSLLRSANALVKRVGIAPTDEETSRLRQALPDVTFLNGDATRLPCESAFASKIVCNSVLLLLSSEKEVRAALAQISRVARLGAAVFLGEIPEADEISFFRKYRGNSVVGYLFHQLIRNGFRSFVSSAKEVATALFGRSTLVLNSAQLFHSPPEQFVRMAGEYGLQHIRHFKYQRLDKSGKVVESPLRYNYLFRKESLAKVADSAQPRPIASAIRRVLLPNTVP